MERSEIEEKIKFIRDFTKAANAADGSQVDSNANVTVKDIAVLEAELPKKDTIQLNRALVYAELEKKFSKQVADQYLKDLEDHLIYVHDETSLKPYCASISLYPYLIEGTKNMGGCSKAPTNLHSFCGSFVNLVYQVAANFAGAIATTEFLMYFDYFARKEYGDCYVEYYPNETWQALQGVIYSLNEPAAARGNQSVFWNISIFDKYYFDGIFGEFHFPDGSRPDYDHIAVLQKFFMECFRKERQKELLTFPVITAAMLVDEDTKKPKDQDFESLCARQMSLGHSFFIYQSTKADSLSSCCRLRNELSGNEFSFTLGAGGVSTGSFQVITLNLNRLHQKHAYDTDVIGRIHKYLAAYRAIYQRYIDAGLLPAYTAGYISLDKQFGTIGVNGMLEAYEYFQTCTHVYDGVTGQVEFMSRTLNYIKNKNTDAYEQFGFRFNTEFVPAENLGVKNAKWDREDGLFVPRDCYNSYFFAVEDTELTVLDKLKLHGEPVANYLDGGAACHLNLEQIPSYANCISLIRTAAKLGVPYWTTNVLCTICNTCGYINPETKYKCDECGSDDIDHGTRIIGYLKRISNFSAARRAEASWRAYTHVNF